MLGKWKTRGGYLAEVLKDSDTLLFGYVDLDGKIGKVNTYWDRATLNNSSKELDLTEHKRSEEDKNF